SRQPHLPGGDHPQRAGRLPLRDGERPFGRLRPPRRRRGGPAGLQGRVDRDPRGPRPGLPRPLRRRPRRRRGGDGLLRKPRHPAGSDQGRAGGSADPGRALLRKRLALPGRSPRREAGRVRDHHGEGARVRDGPRQGHVRPEVRGAGQGRSPAERVARRSQGSLAEAAAMVRALLVLVLAGCAQAAPSRELPVVATFSIVAYDPESQELGIAVQSKFIAVGAVVPWAKAGVGAIATQSYANTTYGPKALELLSKGETPEAVMVKLTEDDKRAGVRQV